MIKIFAAWILVLSVSLITACGHSGSSRISTTTTTTTDDAADTTTDEAATFDYSVPITLSDSGNGYVLGSYSSGFSVSESDGTTTMSLNGSAVITIAPDAYGISVTSDMPDGSYVEFALTGTASAASLTFYSAEQFKLSLNGVSIKSTDGPAINIQSGKAYVVLSGTNTLTDSSTYSSRTSASGNAMDLKACFFSEKTLVFSGDGSLTINGNGTAAGSYNSEAKNGLTSDNHINITAGTITVVANTRDGIHVNDAFIMSGGTLSVTATAGKGIKVKGKEDDTNPMGYIDISGGSITITSYDKAMTAHWTTDDADTSSTSDDPDPYVNISGGTFNITTTGTPVENELAPEGIESKSAMTISGGTLYICTTDDAINANGNLTISEESASTYIYAKASKNDAIDSNMSITINGGVIEAISTASNTENSFDHGDNYTMTINGGTVLGCGPCVGSISTNSSQHVIVMGSSSSTQGIGGGTSSSYSLSSGVFALTSGKPGSSSLSAVYSAYLSTSPSTLIISSPSIVNGTYYVSKGGSCTYDTVWHDIYSGNLSYTAGTTYSNTLTVSSVYTYAGGTIF